MKNVIRLFISLVIALVVLVAIYVGGNMAYATFTDFQPPATQIVDISNTSNIKANKDEYSFMIWNIGYGGLGAEVDFFYDGGVTVRPTEDLSKKYLDGIRHIVQAAGDRDFVLLQEVDVDSRRSYFFNQLEAVAGKLPYHSYSYAANYEVDHVPMPLEKPWDVLGRVRAGLATYSKYTVSSAMRYQFPGKYDWPKRVFMLDRCFLVSRVPLANGKEMVVVNTHNSAYDGGTLKQQEMELLREFVQEEYGNGNYVVVGGDWNQIPNDFDNNTFAKGGDTYEQTEIPADYLPNGWQFVYDKRTPTNRKLSAPYNEDKTFTTIIDYYLLSPNIEALDVHTGDLNFKFSDHQPVYLNIKLK